MAFYVVQVFPDLPPARRQAAAETVPGFLDPPAPYPELLSAAGFEDVTERDVTPDYRNTASRWLVEAGNLESELRAVLGDDLFEEKQGNRRRSVGAIEAGDVGRSLLTATASR